MGKLLLQSVNSVNKPIPKVTKEKTLKQQVLTEEPFARLFRIRKNRNDQHQEVGEPTDEIKICLKSACQSPEQRSNDTNGKIDLSDCRLGQDKKTRWDINSTSEISNESPCGDLLLPWIKHEVQFDNEDVDMDKSDDDSHSFSESLQSDDDVLGPWIELGLVESNDYSKKKDPVKYQDCQDCIKINENRQPLEPGSSCTRCSLQWQCLIQKLITAMSEAPVATVKKKYKKQSKITIGRNVKEHQLADDAVSVQGTISSNKKVITPKKASRKYTKPVIPPTKSRHSQKTNFKMSHFTTGAFMTRKTVRTLADPEHGFYPNTHGFVYGQNVEVLNINGYWYPGTLQMMDKGKVKVVYDDWDDQDEWIIMGSRRLRVSTQNDNTTLESQKTKNDSIASETIDVIHFEDGAPTIPTTCAKADDDYVNSTLDKDPSQIFNDNEVFMTRSMARGLVDEHGFKPNSFGYRRNRAVSITFYSKQNGSRKMRQESVGYLREMHQNQVRVWYPDLHQSEWIPVGSRRLRVMTEEEEKNILSNSSIDFSVQEVPPTVNTLKGKEKEDDTASIMPLNKNANIPRVNYLKKTNDNGTTPASAVKSAKENTSDDNVATNNEFLTTGAFATRRAMRQLKDKNGFTPNPYGYTNGLAVEVLNTRSGKTKFWECGKLVAMRPGHVRVHYEGWADIYDEWIMVGSRRIRVSNSVELEKQSEDGAFDIKKGLKSNDLLVAESNPELVDESKRNHKHQIVRPQDYQDLGMLVNIEELAVKEAQKKERRGEYLPELQNPAPKNFKKKTQRLSTKKKHQVVASNCTTSCANNPLQSDNDDSPANNKQIISLRLAQAEASKNYKFVANVYGYDYMQHVTVLHLDKKLYEGRLVSMHKNKVKIHYCGWLDSFDEYITLGSRRLQAIENDHEVQCIEPNYQQRYEQILTEKAQMTSEDATTSLENIATTSTQPLINRFSRKRLTLDDIDSESEFKENDIEYHKDPTDANTESKFLFLFTKTDTWKVYCNQCSVVIKQFRYYCTYCETPSVGHDYQSFELCLRCFDQNFPFWHEHPRSSFAIQAVIDTEIGPRPIKGELITVWEEDILEILPNKDETIIVFTGNIPIDTDQGYKYLKRWKRRKLCAFCNDDDDTSKELGSFIGPFVIATFNKNGVEKKRSFWAHDSCARYSPEVFCTPEGKWYNVTLALRRGRGMRCHGCKEKGATIGCFESKCNKSFHLPCSQKPVSYFQNGVIFWCGIHEAYYNKKDTYVNIFNCDGCNKKLVDESWFTCVPCASSYFSSFDLCSECYENFPADHDHNEDEFEETSFAILKEMEAQKATEAARAKEDIRAANAKKKKKPLFPRRRRKLADGSTPVSCCYCGTYDADTWRKGYDGGVIMCNPCFELALLIDNDGRPGEENMPLVIDNNTIEFDKKQNQQHKYVASIEDYSHKPYLTRDTLSATKFSDSSTGQRLASYEPQPNQLFSLTFDSTYFDIPGRAPRWATHSGTDYHGTWLPQTVRRAILKYTSKDERVLSNFLGRGTDAIECFLLQRRCCGVDINPAAVALSQRNCCFEIPPGLTSAEYRPIVAQADSRNLSGSLFADESYHHILSHPPYKDCVAYSTHLEGDLSRFTSVEDFKKEYTKVVKESWRLLKMDRRLTLGIGDNREHCFYIPVGFHLIRLYIDQGFELEELVIKRQRYCSAFGLGTYLCVQFDFLVFTHEFIATFKKVPKENTDKMAISKDNESDVLEMNRTMHGVPSSAIMRKSVVMGTVWVFKPTEEYRFEKLCISRMVERFGKDDGNWEHIELLLEVSNLFDKEYASEKEETPTIGDDNPLSEYEQQRLSRIEENNKTLLKLGLISELSEESDDVIHYETMMNKAVYEGGDLVLMITCHRSDLLPDKINSYRRSIVNLAIEATSKLAPKGMFIVGTQDIRDSYTGKLWPMTMLILEDIEKEVGRNTIKLKEMVVTVPDGYSKDRKRDFVEVEMVEEEEEDVIDIETVNHDYVPIVHAVYLIFQKF
ncbi:uncharacterized protein EV154DRAFT_411870 [Mucor mucedo]|uniref:uncharacterized protein n=1 Tax=Mucor mucedo TaxID=29922 RepID=UPI00221F8582|nr:uncharacterized protein EV154DRAFT_411870 [Mucor mucedo]KAI7896252.1 hypothetical protein EV154DRAFT_411870 [Mucor mucedo]